MELTDDHLFNICWKIFLGEPVNQQEHIKWKLWQQENPGKDYLYVIQLRLHSHHLDEIEKNSIVEQFWREQDERHPDIIDLPDIRPAAVLWYRRPVVKVAVLIIALLGAGLFFYLERPMPKEEINISVEMEPLHADSTISIVLDNGKTIPVATNYRGVIAELGPVKLERDTNGEFRYSFSGHGQRPAFSHIENSLKVPRGMLATIRMTDGSRVYLNATSTLHFPVSFEGRQRRVNLDGEAYFEVARQDKKTFTVGMQDKDSIVVRGTHFSVRAYQDQSFKDIALERGGIEIFHESFRTVPKAGQVVRITAEGRFELQKTNFYQMVAYKDGNFYFDSCTIETVLREIGSWYGVKMEPGQAVSKTQYYHLDTFARSLPLASVLKKLKDAHIQVTSEQAAPTN